MHPSCIFVYQKTPHFDIVKKFVSCFWCNVPASGRCAVSFSENNDSFSENNDSRPYLRLLLDMQYLYSDAKTKFDVVSEITRWHTGVINKKYSWNLIYTRKLFGVHFTNNNYSFGRYAWHKNTRLNEILQNHQCLLNKTLRIILKSLNLCPSHWRHIWSFD